MAQNSLEITAPVEAVWGVLADPRLYAIWVVGASAVRRVDGHWPQPGASFHHTQSLLLRDTSTVLEAEPPHRLLLEARARPLAVVNVEARLAPEGGGTRLTITEWVTGGPADLLPRKLTDGLIHVRNAIGIRRLRDLVEIGLSQSGR